MTPLVLPSNTHFLVFFSKFFCFLLCFFFQVLDFVFVFVVYAHTHSALLGTNESKMIGSKGEMNQGSVHQNSRIGNMNYNDNSIAVNRNSRNNYKASPQTSSSSININHRNGMNTPSKFRIVFAYLIVFFFFDVCFHLVVYILCLLLFYTHTHSRQQSGNELDESKLLSLKRVSMNEKKRNEYSYDNRNNCGSNSESKFSI